MKKIIISALTFILSISILTTNPIQAFDYQGYAITETNWDYVGELQYGIGKNNGKSNSYITERNGQKYMHFNLSQAGILHIKGTLTGGAISNGAYYEIVGNDDIVHHGGNQVSDTIDGPLLLPLGSSEYFYLQAGDYYIRTVVHGQGCIDAGAYYFNNVYFVPTKDLGANEVEPTNNTFSGATAIKPHSGNTQSDGKTLTTTPAYKGFVNKEGKDQYDYYKFRIDHRQTVTLYLRTFSHACDVYNADKVLIDSYDGGNAYNSGKYYLYDLEPGTYYIRVRVHSSATASESEQYNLKVKYSVYCNQTSISSISNTVSGIKIKWTKPSNITGYKIYRSVSGGSYSLVKTITSNATLSYLDKNVSNGKKYSYKIKTYRNYGGITHTSAYSNIKKTYRLVKPTLTLTSGSKKFTAKWSKNGKASGYQIKYSTSSTFASNNKTTSVSGCSTVKKTVSKLKEKKRYYVKVRSYKTVSGIKYYSTYSDKKYVTTKA